MWVGVMRSRLLFGILPAALCCTVLGAAAQNSINGLDPFGLSPPTLTEGQKRRILAPLVRAATDCIARNALAQPGIVEAYRGLNLQPIISVAWTWCTNEIGQVATEHDKLHGPGTGTIFVQGPYATDLPRAVTSRIKVEVERRIAANDAAEAERRADAARAEARRRHEVAQAENAASTTKALFYSCANAELAKLVGSAETAETLTTAALTLCRREAADAMDAATSAVRLKGEIPETEIRTFREALRGIYRENVLTSAVQVKAAVNTPATSAPVASSRPAAAAATTAGPAPQTRELQKPSIGKAVAECFTVMNRAQKDKFVDRQA